jgi:hypothetical protein
MPESENRASRALLANRSGVDGETPVVREWLFDDQPQKGAVTTCQSGTRFRLEWPFCAATRAEPARSAPCR